MLRRPQSCDQQSLHGAVLPATYTPPGSLASLTNGASLISTLYYNNRLQPCRISVKNTGTAPSACTDAVNIGNVLDFTYDFSAGAADNGNVTGITNNRDTTRSQSFAYDTLSRISTAKTTSTSGTKCWDEAFGYDAWGNLLTIDRISGFTCSNEELLNSMATSQNRISGNTYDTAGNLTAIPSIATYTYNAENQLTATAGVTYTYDGDGKRVQKSNGKLYWYGMGSDPLDETDLAGNTNNTSFNEYIFFGGKRIARRDSTNAVSYYLADHLGSARMVANSSGTLDDSDFYPFGGERVIASSSGTSYKFTGKERDAESGLDHFQFRKFSSAMGRFMSPDPAGMMAVDIGSPQTLNRYSYVLNNPLAFTDPFGLDCAYLNSSGTGLDKNGIDQNSSSGECGKTGGYWVEGTITQVNIDSNATTISLTGTTNGTNQTSASYQQDAVVTVGEYNNTSNNPYNHIALGLAGHTQFGQNPRSDARFLWALSMHGPTASVPGAIKPQVGGRLLGAVRIRATGMQAQMLQNAMNQSAQNPPPYTIFGQTGCDCGTWAQMMLGDAGINAGPPAPLPDVLMQQLNQLYPQQQQPPQ